MHTACWITKATNTHTEYVILTAFPWQQWLHEHTSVLCYTYVTCHCFTFTIEDMTSSIAVVFHLGLCVPFFNISLLQE